MSGGAQGPVAARQGWRPCRLFLLLLIPLLALSCGKKTNANGAQAALQTVKALGSAQTQPLPPAGFPTSTAQSALDAKKGQAQRPIPLPVATNAGLSSLLSQAPGSQSQPEDFKIGLLGEQVGSTAASATEANADQADQSAALATAISFLTALSKGKTDASLLAPESQKSVSDFIAFAAEQKQTATSFRIGRPRSRENNTITMAVRLFSAIGSAEGEIYLTRESKEWLVSDLQVNFAQLAEKKPELKERFFPSSYHWMLTE
jgi:hypothetical protein